MMGVCVGHVLSLTILTPNHSHESHLPAHFDSGPERHVSDVAFLHGIASFHHVS